MFGDTGRPIVRVCCGPRCGAEPGHRAVYDAVEKAAESAELDVRPTMCQGLCGSGVTIVLPDREKRKIRDVAEAADALSTEGSI
jgi:NADH:ubiquinone oxidoreductase subunit E